jgi:hypothetical protein
MVPYFTRESPIDHHLKRKKSNAIGKAGNIRKPVYPTNKKKLRKRIWKRQRDKPT